MTFFTKLSFFLLALFTIYTNAIGTDDQVYAPIDYGTFGNPSANVRPRFRYWVPDASVDLSTIANDISNIGRVGAGGIELLGYYFYGEIPGDVRTSPVPVDWTKYGWGTSAWKKLTKSALEAVKANSLVMDFAMGPNQGAGVPAPVDSEGLQWNLLPFNVSVSIGGFFNDIVPGWGSGFLVSASIGLVTASVNTSASEPSLPNDSTPTRIQSTLSNTSLLDVTDLLDNDGRLSLQFPSNVTGIEYILFTFYQVHTEYREQEAPGEVIPGVTQSPVTSYRENGSWVVDHFSAAGAQAVTGFWSQYLLDDSTRELLAQVGNYGWEDSQEFGTAVYITWTPQLLQKFQTNRAYNLPKYLPILFHNNNGFTGSQFPTWYVTDEVDGGESHVADYRQTLLELNQIYLQSLTEFSNSLGVQFSAQVGYNLPLDMPAEIPSVNAPECETLDFNSNIDAYRQFSGAANFAGKRIVSSECGANRGLAYQLTIPHLLWDIKRSIAGSINNFVFHGYPYTGVYPNTTWPGFTTFSYSYSDMHGPRQPAWEFYSDFMDWTARNQFVAQSGVPKVDLAFWLKVTNWEAHEIVTKYTPQDLENAGYTYQYLSPNDLSMVESYVENSTLAPKGQAFQAMIVRANESLTIDGVAKLSQYAYGGLPILFSGGLPSYLASYNESGSQYVNATLAAMTSLSNVHIVPYENLASILGALSIEPRAKVDANSTWYTSWREDKVAGIDYAIIYNDAAEASAGQGNSVGNVTFASTGQPFSFDAWTGEITPILQYHRDSRSITIPIQLAGNQSIIIGLRQNVATHPIYFNNLPADVWTSVLAGSSTVVVKSRCNSLITDVELSNGTSLSFPPASLDLASFSLLNWSLTIESWSAPSDIFSQKTVITNSSYTIPSLISWNNVSPELRNVSGRGYYTTIFTWPPLSLSFSTPYGATIVLPPIQHTARLFLNNHQLPPLDITHPVGDIGPYLKTGVNRVEIVVSTPLGNALRPVWDSLMTSGNTAASAITLPDEIEYGLVGEVTVAPYWGIEIW